jgi:hypothetical protein
MRDWRNRSSESYDRFMPKSVGATIAEEFTRGDFDLAAAIDGAIVAARTDEGRQWRMKLAAVVVACGTRRGSGPYRLTVPQEAIRAVTPEGQLAESELTTSRLLTYTPQRRRSQGKN